MELKLDDVCEYVLSKIANRDDGEYYELYPYFELANGELVSDNGIDPKCVVSEFEKYGISKPLDNERCELTELGVKIGQGIGFKQYVSDLNKAKTEHIKKQEIKEVKELEKLDLDIYLGKFEKKQGTKFKKWGFIITIINLIILLSGFFISNQSNKLSEQQVLDQKKHTEKKLDKLENQILTLERKIDSLNYQNSEAIEQP